MPSWRAFPSSLGLIPKRQLPNAFAGCGEDGVGNCGSSWRDTRLAESAHRGIAFKKMHLHIGRLGESQEGIVMEVGLHNGALIERDGFIETGGQAHDDAAHDLRGAAIGIYHPATIHARPHLVRARASVLY